MNDQWPSSGGFGRSNYSNHNTGIPATEPLWEENYGSGSDILAPFVAYKDKLIYCLWTLSREREVFIINIDTGEVLEKVLIPPSEDTLLNISYCEQYLLVTVRYLELAEYHRG